ncbi:MAG: alpha/beta hydrolase [Candidatus Thorarchaeota archaeon]|jgi:pimeloyl-ACP methyl ester carboxylesterase
MTLDIPSLRNEFDGPHHLITTSDNQILFLRKWEPTEGAKNSAILLLHGITAYSGPYGMIANPLTELGFTVYGLDLRGHGLSDGNRGDSPGIERFVNDLSETVDFVKQYHGKIVLLGHSLGVLSSMLAISNSLENIDGAALLSGARTTRPQAYPAMSATQKLKIFFSSLFRPGKPVIRYYREGMVGLDDPLFNFDYTFRFMKIIRLRDFEFPDLENRPIFVGVGDKDELFSVAACRELFDEIPSTNKMFHIFQGGKHSEFPPESMTPFGKWLDEQFD